MRYIVRYSGEKNGPREAARQLAELKEARRELKEARRAIRSRV